MKSLLETERIRLRQVVSSDETHLHALDNDPEVMRWINGGVPVSMEYIRREIMPLFMTYDKSRPLFGFWIVESIETGTFLGWVCMRSTGNKGEASIGYRLTRASWGKGLAIEAMGALMKEGMARGRLTRIIANTYEENIASRKVLEKLGMTLHRRYRMTAEALLMSDTSQASSTEPWDGDELEYVKSL